MDGRGGNELNQLIYPAKPLRLILKITTRCVLWNHNQKVYVLFESETEAWGEETWPASVCGGGVLVQTWGLYLRASARAGAVPANDPLEGVVRW